MSEQETFGEKELAAYLRESALGTAPRSPGEAMAAAEEATPELPDATEAPAEDAPIVVEDEPKESPEPLPPPPEVPGEPTPETEEEPPEPEGEQDENVVWAQKRYGDDPARWAKAAFDQEQHIGRLTNEKRESDELASQWYEYAQTLESQPQQFAGAMPMSAQEEQWVENSLTNPVEYARQAAFSGNVQLYNGVINRVAEENPGLAAQIGTQVQMELASYAQHEAAQQQQQPSLQDSLGQSFQRLGIDLGTYGPRIQEKVVELGEYHPYVQALIGQDPAQRDLALQAVYDLVRATNLNVRKVEQEANIARENELRRAAAGIQTGGIQPPPPPAKQPAFLGEMQKEWERRGQWADEG